MMCEFLKLYYTASSLVYLSFLLVWSLLSVLCQVLFQIVLATDYSDQLQPCELYMSCMNELAYTVKCMCIFIDECFDIYKVTTLCDLSFNNLS